MEPTAHCPTLSPSWHKTRASPLPKWHMKVVSGRFLPAAPGVLSWTRETFLMGVFSKWASPPEQILFQQIVDFKRKAQVYFEGKKISPLLQNSHLACEDEGAQRLCLLWVPASGKRWPKSSSNPVTILKSLLRSFYFIAPELKAQRSLKPWISIYFSNPLLVLLPIVVVLLLFLILKVSGGKKNQHSMLYLCDNYIVLKRLFLRVKIPL